MKSRLLMKGVVAALPICIGCTSESQSDGPPPSGFNAKITEDRAATLSANGRVEDKIRTDPAMVENPGLSDLFAADGVERDATERLVAVSLRDQELTLAEVAMLNEASSIKRLNAAGARLTDADMELLEAFTSLEELELGVNTLIADDSLRHLSGLQQLRVLSLAYCPKLTGAGFEYLGDLDEVVSLNISNNKNLNDDNLKYLSELKNLQVLTASSMSSVTDAGMQHLATLHGLRRLRLASNNVTDQGLQYLSQLTVIETLNLSGCTKLTDDGINKLQQALPGCTIIR